ncbi:MAG: ABC transporter substrate-binding protein [Caldilineaceae bacterium]
MRLRFTVFSLLVVVSLLFGACAPPMESAPGADAGPAAAPDTGAAAAPVDTGDIPRERTLIIGFEGGPSAAPENAGLNPGAAFSQGNHQVMIESLYYLNYQTGEMIPWLAADQASWNDDFTVVTIPLREGIKWSDGEPFTADDIVFTINMLKENTTLSYASTVVDVENAEAVDELTVQITLAKPDPRFIVNAFGVRIWGAVRIVPKHIWEGQDPNTFNNFDLDKGWPVWTGPYKLVKATSTEFVFDRRDDWWAAETGFQDLPAPERIIFVDAGPDERKAAALSANEVDGEPSLRIDTFNTVLEQNPDAIGWTADPPHAWIDPCPGELGFNTRIAPWDDPVMRWAVAYALPNQQIGDAQTGGFGQVSPYNFPDYPALQSWLTENQDLLDEYDSTAYDPDKAKELIESAGYTMGSDGFYEKDGERLTVDILFKTEEPILPALVVSAFQDVGIDAAPRALAGAAYFDARDTGDFEIETHHVACGSVVEPYDELNLFHSRWIVPIGERASNNKWGWSNAEYDQIVDEMQTIEPGAARQHELFRRALEIRLQELPIISLTQQRRVVPYSNAYWTNWPTSENDYHHPPNWWMNFLMLVVAIEPAQ